MMPYPIYTMERIGTGELASCPSYTALASMDSLTVEELHSLRLAIFDNAENLHKEAKLLLEHGMFSRAYLLAHFCFEELGKIPIIIGAIGRFKAGETVDWRKLRKRFYSHTAKISSKTITTTRLV